ncbi:MAG: autotransporter outer membrane beta-barrel domain-containing protein [Alphaproteobacteria bacterium]|nr:autotransporter outer membrane beta-barrel domain-containing protein [Alphaproteobacteria bacterium]
MENDAGAATTAGQSLRTPPPRSPPDRRSCRPPAPRTAPIAANLIGGLFGFALAITLSPAPAAAQIIDSGNTIIAPGTQGSPWNVGTTLTVGLSGVGKLEIPAGGAVSSSSGVIGSQSTSLGWVTVNGPDASWKNSTSLTIGRSGTGWLTITGGRVSNSSGTIGQNRGSSGTVTISGAGATWTNSDILMVGREGTGTLVIRDGAVVTSAGGRADIGYDVGSNGSVDISGAGSKWSVSGYLTIGLLGTGSLNITDGAAVSNGAAYIGNKTGASGEVTVDGAGSTWKNSMGLYIGIENGAYGSLRVTGGGVVVSDFGGMVANNIGSAADITVDGAGSKWIMTYGDFELGRGGTGTLAITNGGLVSDGDGNIANNPRGVASVTVDGAGSTWTNSGNLYIAAGAIVTTPGGGTGTLVISNGGSVSAKKVQLGSDTSGAGIINIGAAQGSAARAPGSLLASTLEMKNFGQLVFNHSDQSGGYVFAPDVTGTGDVEQISGITVVTGANLYSGATNISGGSWRAGVVNTFSPNSSVAVAGAGTLDLAGFSQTVAGLTNAGIVNMGTRTPPGTVLTTTNYVGQGGSIGMNTFFGPDNSPSDKLVIDGGTATGTTALRFTNAGGPATGTTANGILVVEAVNGATTAPGAFAMASRDFRVGVKDYRLFQGGLNGTEAENWFLRSTFIPEPGPGPGPSPPLGPGGPSGPPSPILGPEPGTYSAIQPLALQLGLATLGTHDERVGDQNIARPGLSEPDALANDGQPAAWGRVLARQLTASYQGFADPRADARITLLQSGIDLVRSSELTAAGHRDYGGLYFAYGNLNADISGLVTNAAATAYVHQHTGALNLDAWSGGAYWTHYGAQGWYLELVLQGTSYQNSAATEFARLKTSGSGFASSLEGGYPFPLPQLGPGFVLEPQAQIVWQRVNFDNGNDGLGAVASGTTALATARVGLKASWSITDSQERVWIPNLRVNYWNDLGGTATTLFDQDPVPVQLRSRYLDISAGVTTRINSRLSGFVDAGYQCAVAGEERHGVRGIAGLRYRW